MTREDIIAMAREAGLEVVHYTSTPDSIERFATLVAAAEREECLEKVRIRIMREAYDFADHDNSETYNALKVMCSDVLKLIRARSEP